MAEVPLLELENLHIVRSGARAEVLVHDLCLRLEAGQSLGLVGESGSGKSLTALAALNLLPEPEVTLSHGTIRFQGQDLRALSERSMNELRGSRMAVIVQDALAALNPVRRVGSQLEEVFRFHRTRLSRSQQRDRIHHCLQRAGLPDHERMLRAYPHELSGGMRQRLLLAMALLLEPDLLIADEPTTALDVTLQAHWVREVHSLQREQGIGLLFISHDLALVAELCERIAVLYKGMLIEMASTLQLMEAPQHPYTRAMMDALPRAGQEPHFQTRRATGSASATGCPYVTHCPKAVPLCQQTRPVLQGTADHVVACHVVNGKGNDDAIGSTESA